MSMSQNIFPEKGDKWEYISAHLNDPSGGSCIVINLDYVSIAIHYGSEGNKRDFLSRFKATVAALPDEETEIDTGRMAA